MKKSKNDKKENNFFEKFANAATKFTGSSIAFIAATAIVILWALTGPVFHYSETWQLVINTGTTIVTFLMVFLIQNTQNRDARSMHLQLDELIESIKGASNAYLDLDEMSDDELDKLRQHFRHMHDKVEKHQVKRKKT